VLRSVNGPVESKIARAVSDPYTDSGGGKKKRGEPWRESQWRS